jgi:hypothetical protein
MKKAFLVLLTLAFTLTILSSTHPPSAHAGPMLKMVAIEVNSPGQIKKLARMGIDISEVVKGPLKDGPRGVPMQTYRVEAVVSALDQKKLGVEGFSWTDVPGRGPVKKIGEEYQVYKSFDAPRNGIKAQLNKIKATYPHICQLKTIGHSIQGRPMLAMRLTNEKIKGKKAQVLFLATHHAREWVATQMAMRLIKYLTANFGSNGRVTDLLNTTEVWVIPVGNPDGYQYTFTNERLWRKNLRDNDGDNAITIADGVDINRNFASHWGLDEEGSSAIWSSGTYRGVAPASEPETQAVVNFIEKNNFKFIVSYHTHGNLILYPWGWQVKTTSLDDPLFVAQAGTDAEPAIMDSLQPPGEEGYDPGVGADLYITNGDFTDWTYGSMGIPSYTVEFTKGYDFRFPDDESMVQTVFEDSLEFALSLAESAVDPGHPVSPVGITTGDVYHTPLTASYGPDQMIEVLARKGLELTLCVNGTCSSNSFTESLGQFYNDQPGTYFSRYVALISGQNAGDMVTYEIKGGTSTLGPYTYPVKSATGNRILVMAAEDYTGDYPTHDPRPSGPLYLSYYTDALNAGGYSYDVWDVDLEAAVPSFSEVLSHYRAAIWYTGDDYAPTVPYGFITHMAEALELRDFINYQNGKVFATGQDLAWLSAVYGQFEEISDDFFQYYLGAYIDMDTGGIDEDTGIPFNVRGEDGDPVLGGLSFSLTNLDGGDGADNQCCSSTFLSTNYFLPHFQGTVAARYDRPGGPTEPHSGDYYIYSQMADMAYKRLGGTFTLPAGAASLKFWVSYDIEADWDYLFVEIAEAGTGNWTTLPDLGGMTTQSTGDSCASGWVDEIHPFLANYMDSACNPAGITGEWHAFTGKSGGWKQVEIDLSAYAGRTVELYISYASDWGTQGLGVFVDDIELAGFPLEDFEVDMGAWTVSLPPAGSGAFNNWLRITGAGFPEGPAIRTDNSVYFGFGFEAIDTADNRNAVMDRVMKYLGQ